MKSLPTSKWASGPQNSRSSMSHHASDNVEGTTHIKDEYPDAGDSEVDSGDDDDDDFQNGADKVMLTGRASSPKTASTNRGGSNGYADDDNAALPLNIKWPPYVLIVNYNSTKHSIMKQFIKPQTHAKKLIKANEHLNLTVSQLKAAYAYAVNNVKHRVNLTQLTTTNPGLNTEGIQAEAERQIQEVIAQVETKNIQTKEEQLAVLRAKIANPRNKGKIQKFLKQERLLTTPQAVIKAEIKEKKDQKKARREAKDGKKPKHKHTRMNGHGAIVKSENKPRGMGDLMRADGTWGAVVDTDIADKWLAGNFNGY